MSSFFTPLQADLLSYKESLKNNNVVIDKTNLMFLELNLKILEFLGTEDPLKLDEWCDYNILTMGDEFLKVITGTSTGEKAQGVLTIFFLRIAQEMKVKYETIYNEDLEELYSIMTSRGYKYSEFISKQKHFSLDFMTEIIARRESQK